MAKFLVTGGAGFIGSNIVEYLVKKNNDVIVIDNLVTGKLNNLDGLMDKIDFYEQSILDINCLKKCMKNVDYVLHHAAIPSVTKSVNDPILTHNVNINGTLNVLVAARDANVKRVVFASSSSVYGDQKEINKNERMVLKPLSPYATQKATCEFYCKNFYELYGLKTVCLRYFNVFGPKQDPSSDYAAVIPSFISKMLTRKCPIIYGDGLQTRDFTYIDNIIQANILACESEKSAGETFNIAHGNSINLRDLILEINQLLGSDIRPEFTNPKKGDVKYSCADISKAKRLLNYDPKVYFVLGLEKTVDWYKTQSKSV